MIGKIPTHSTRLRPDQTQEIAAVRKLRAEVIDLRDEIQGGSYDDQEVKRLWKLAESASFILHIANSEMAERAGLGVNFFTTMVRDKRRPKLQNFLRALSVMLEVATERLADVDGDGPANHNGPIKINQRIQQDRSSLLVLAQALSQMALDEIKKLDAERPNDPDRIAGYEKQRELLQIFADGFARIARALAVLDVDLVEPVKMRKAAKAIESVGNGFNRWWEENADEAIDWSVRIPVLAAAISLLGWAGAPVILGTTIAAALVGGEKVLKAISKPSAKGSKK